MRGPAGRRVTRDGMHHHQIQFAISVEIGCRYCGRIESRSVREQSWCVECPRACPCEQCEAQLRTVQCDYQIHLSVAVEVPWGNRLRLYSDREIGFRAERSVTIS